MIKIKIIYYKNGKKVMQVDKEKIEITNYKKPWYVSVEETVKKYFSFYNYKYNETNNVKYFSLQVSKTDESKVEMFETDVAIKGTKLYYDIVIY